VYRLLKQAREEGIVEIHINWPIERSAGLEQALVERFDLREALVLNAGNTPSNLQQLGELGAQYLTQILEDGMTLAVCMGRSTYAVINAISPDFQAHIRVAQATGSIPFSMYQLDSSAMARRLAEKLGGEVLYLSSPLTADSVDAAAVMRSQRDINHTLTIAGQADVALLGIGNLNPQTSAVVRAGFITAEMLSELIGSGAVGDMAGQLFDQEGHLHKSSYNQRVISVSFEDLCRIPTVVAVAAGEDKVNAIIGALKTCIIKVLITDALTARAILKVSGV
jgi:DNA-binding transcriptional regulator LsrR (DeoR family)